MYPSELILESLPSTAILFFRRPVPKFKVLFHVLKDPYDPFNKQNGSVETEDDFTLMLPPNAPVPFVEVPIPRWTCTFSVEEAMSGRSTQYMACDSASLMGIPLMVTFTRVASLPRMRMPVYPMPAPASEVTTTEGRPCSRKGMSCPRFFFSISSL